MTVNKLFKRYLKEVGIYGSDAGKSCILFMDYYNISCFPFNSFRWDTTIQGHLYWFEIALGWLVFLYDNFDNVDDKELSKVKIKQELGVLLTAYAPTVLTRTLLKNYNEVIRVMNDVD